jgi:hypothetical protein
MTAEGTEGPPTCFELGRRNFVESSVKRSILTTFVATKAQKRLKLTLTIASEFRLVLRDFKRFGAYIGRFWVIFSLSKASRKARLGQLGWTKWWGFLFLGAKGWGVPLIFDLSRPRPVLLYMLLSLTFKDLCLL